MNMLIKSQRLELTEYILYKKLAKSCRNAKNRMMLAHIAKVELEHYEFFRKLTQRNVKPYWWKIWLFYALSKMIGITFGVKLMEREERFAQKVYASLSKRYPEVKRILKEEEQHEKELVNLIEEDRTKYISSIVLGLNDALVELTGALAGFTLALQKTNLIALAGLVTGVSAALSMAASEYLAKKADKHTKPKTASAYTGFAYLLAVVLLVTPFFIAVNPYTALALTLSIAIAIIFVFTFYSSVVKDVSFKKQFLEMAAISLGVSAISFGLAYVMRGLLGV